MTTLDSPGTVLRFGVLYADALEGWQVRCLDELTSLAEAQWVVAIAAPHSPRLPGAWATLPRIGLVLTRPAEDAAPAQRSAEAQGSAEGRVSSAEAQGSAEAARAAAASIRESELDFILCFADGVLPIDILDLPRHGIWRYHWGDWINYHGASASFWEVYERAAASGALLVRVQRDAQAAVVLREGFLRTQLLSVRRNRQQLQDRFTAWPAQVCREIVRTGRLSPRATLRAAAARPAPALRHHAVLAARIAARIVATGFRSLFRHDQWNVGIIDQPLEHMLGVPVARHVEWLPATPRAELRADPFGTLFAGRPTILCEYFSYRDNRGYIVAVDPAGNLPDVRVRIGPEPAVHLSYPYLVEVDGRLLCLPESSAAGEVVLYDLETFPDRWTRGATLLERGLADATMFEYQGRWWLAAGDVADKGANSELHLWFASAPAGPWTAHRGNPVKVDVRSARPAGTPFWVDGELYRPAQDCSSTYGARVIINRVTALTPDEFREEPAASVDPDPQGRYPAGLHTLSRLGARTLIDGKRSVFVAAEFMRVLRHYIS